MRKSGILAFILILGLFPMLLTGCYDAAEVDDEVYALVIGADKGVANKVRVTVQYPNYQDGGGRGGGGGGGGESGGEGSTSREISGTIVVSAAAPTILEAMNILNASVPRKISLKHVKMIVFSEEYAKEGIGDYLEPMARYRETRRITQVVVCSGTAEEFILENKSSIGKNMSKAIELLESQYKNNGYFPRSSFHEFYKDSLSTYRDPFAIYGGLNDYSSIDQPDKWGDAQLKMEFDAKAGELPRIGATKRELGGTALFRGDKMVGTLNIFETRYFMMVTGDFRRAMMTLEDSSKPGAAIQLDVRLGRKPSIKAYFEKEVPVIKISLMIEADIGAIQSRQNYESLARIDEFNRMIENQIEAGVRKVVEKTQLLESDVFGFGYYLARYFGTIQEWEAYGWTHRYKDARIDVEVNANVRRTGLIFEALPVTQ